MKQYTIALLFLLIGFLKGQETINIEDFSITNKKKSTIIYYKKQKIKEFDSPRLSLFKMFKNYLVLKINPFFTSDDAEFYLINNKGELLFEKPFTNRDFEYGMNSKFSIMTFPDFAFVVDSELKEVPGTRFTKIKKSNYNNEADLSVVWQKYGKKSPLYLYEIEHLQSDKSIKKGLIDLATATVIAQPIFHKISYYGLLEKGIYTATLEPNGKDALYDFTTSKISELYDGIYNSEGNLRIEINKTFGIMNEQGIVLVKPIYKDIQGFKDGKYFLCKNTKDKIGIIDTKENIIMPFEFSFTNYTITDYPLGNYIPVTLDKLYGYYGIKEKKMVKDFQYDIAGPEVNNVANVRHTNGENQIISFNDYSTGAILKNAKYGAQIKVLSDYVLEKQAYFFDKYKKAANYKIREDALNYFYPYYREFCTETIPNINVRIDTFRKEFGNIMTYEEENILKEFLESQKLLKKKMDEIIEKSGWQVIHLQGY